MSEETVGTVEVQKMYGVCHLIIVQDFFHEVFLSPKPSPEMLGELSALPAGTKVGIEELSPESRSELEQRNYGVRITTDWASTKYWKTVADHCERSGLEVVYLEDPMVWKEYYELKVKQHALMQQPLTLELHRERYAVEIELEYVHKIGREKAILRKIKETSPIVVMVGQGHADFFWDGMEEDSPRRIEGIRFKSYAAEIPPPVSRDIEQELRAEFMVADELGEEVSEASADSVSQFLPPNKLDNNPVMEPKTAAERLFLETRYRALKVGRITGKEPDFIGTWDLQLPAQGLFELFIKARRDGTTEGTINDIFGESEFVGTVTDDRVEFRKQYTTPLAQTLGAVHGVIAYKGTLNPESGKIEGYYKSGKETGTFGEYDMPPRKFEMKRVKTN